MNRENANPFTELEERLRFETLLADLSSKAVRTRPAPQPLDQDPGHDGGAAGSAATPTRSLAGSECGSRRQLAIRTVPNGLVMTRQRKRKERAYEENELIANGTPGMEGARCPP
jgi:hypothetical protein